MKEKQFILKFERLLQLHFGIDLNDVDEDVILECCKDGWSPKETVEWIERKFDLDKINTSQ